MDLNKQFMEDVIFVVAADLSEATEPPLWARSDAQTLIAIAHELTPELSLKSPALRSLIWAYRLGRANGRQDVV